MSETLVVTLTITTVTSLLSLLVGGVIGWIVRQTTYESSSPQMVYGHPEMFDEHGNLSPDEIVAVRFENYDPIDEEEDD